MSVGLLLAGRYRLIRKLGQGGMGSVWTAEDLTLGAEVAVKLIDAAFADSAEAVHRFQREAKAAARIRSTYVVQVLDHGIDNGTPFIAMELLKGESLAQRLKSVGKLSPEQTGGILGHVGRALALAHEHGIVHRDMKPENVFLAREGEDDVGKVLDFGIARQAGGLGDSGGLRTRTGAVMGTPYYMSPEQATGQVVDSLTDIWSYGVIASECLTGRRTFDSESLGGLFHAICMAPMPTPSIIGEVPRGFDEWFSRAVAREKSLRFQTIKEAADDLRAICCRGTDRPLVRAYASQREARAQTSRENVPLEHAQPGSAVGVAGLRTTAVPSSRSIAGMQAEQRRSRVPWYIAGSAIVVSGLFASWHWTNKAAPSTTGAASAIEPAPVVVAGPSATSVALPAASVSPVVASAHKPDAGVNPPITERPDTAAHPQRAPRSRAVQPAQANPPRETTPNSLQAPASATPAPAAPRKREDNAAGI